jgi:hypothetical protein
MTAGGRKDAVPADGTASTQDDGDQGGTASSAEGDRWRIPSPQAAAANTTENHGEVQSGHSGNASEFEMLPEAPMPAAHNSGKALEAIAGQCEPAASSQKPAGDQPPCNSSQPPDRSASDRRNANSPSTAQIPAPDLKPLYDYVQDCRACQARLSAAKQDHLDDSAKLTAVTRERDAAITASKGGTTWRRLRRNAAWFAMGAVTVIAATACCRRGGRSQSPERRELHLTSGNYYYVALLFACGAPNVVYVV